MSSSFRVVGPGRSLPTEPPPLVVLHLCGEAVTYDERGRALTVLPRMSGETLRSIFPHAIVMAPELGGGCMADRGPQRNGAS